ncbi:hypothetical protein [Lichenicola sp.]|uniref:hypothetical protein n=1 Tax=Lichenicola sp. TaxID=2804529 RepID=UPI003B003E4E
MSADAPTVSPDRAVTGTSITLEALKRTFLLTRTQTLPFAHVERIGAASMTGARRLGCR